MKPETQIEKLEENIFTSSVKNLKEVSDQVLEVCSKVTQSKHCYVAYVDPINKDSVGISFSHMTGNCQNYADIGEARFPIRKDGSYGGLLGYSLDTGISFYVKDPASHPAAHGIPPGHIPVDQFLSVPVINNGEIIGQIVLGNPEDDYNNQDLELVNEIAEIYGEVLRELLH
jgi:GAF domain-containing protein